MPPRKSNASAVSGMGDEGVGAGAAIATSAKKGADKDKEREEPVIEDFTMPRAMVQRLAKGSLPPNTHVQKDALTALCKSSTVFINHIASAAQTHTSAANRKTMQPVDVMMGLRDTEYDFMIPRLEAELAKFTEIQTTKRNEYRRKSGKEGSGASGGGSVVGNEVNNGTNETIGGGLGAGGAEGAALVVGGHEKPETKSGEGRNGVGEAEDGQRNAKRARKEVGKGKAKEEADVDMDEDDEDDEQEIEDDVADEDDRAEEHPWTESSDQESSAGSADSEAEQNSLLDGLPAEAGRKGGIPSEETDEDDSD